MNKKACSPDNLMDEGFFGTIKNEFFYSRDWSKCKCDDSIIELVPEATYEFNQGECTISIPEMYDAGTEIIITIDGVRYSSISKLFNLDEQHYSYIVVAGNGSIIGLEDTGEPYMVIMRSTEQDVILIVDLYAERESA